MGVLGTLGDAGVLGTLGDAGVLSATYKGDIFVLRRP